MKEKYMVQKLVIFTILNLMMWPGGALTLSIVLSNVSEKSILAAEKSVQYLQ